MYATDATSSGVGTLLEWSGGKLAIRPNVLA